MVLGVLRMVVQIMTIRMGIHRTGSLIKGSTIIRLTGTVGFQATTMAVIFTMDYGIQPIIIHRVEVKAITRGERREISDDAVMLMSL